MMREIHKIAAIVVKDNSILMVRKKGKDIWTSLGGKIEKDETEEQALLREIKEEINCDAIIINKIGEFKGKAIFDDAILKLSCYLVNLKGNPNLIDEELEEYRFIPKNYRQLGIKLTSTFEEGVIPACIKLNLIDW